MRSMGNLMNRLFQGASSQRDPNAYFNADEIRKFQHEREQNSADAGEVVKRDSYFRL